MASLLLPGTRRFRRVRALVLRSFGSRFLHGVDALDTIEALWAALRILCAANAEGPCPICPTAGAWESKELKEIRRAIEEKE